MLALLSVILGQRDSHSIVGAVQFHGVADVAVLPQEIETVVRHGFRVPLPDPCTAPLRRDSFALRSEAQRGAAVLPSLRRREGRPGLERPAAAARAWPPDETGCGAYARLLVADATGAEPVNDRFQGKRARVPAGRADQQDPCAVLAVVREPDPLLSILPQFVLRSLWG